LSIGAIKFFLISAFVPIKLGPPITPKANSMKLSRQQIRESLNTLPIESILGRSVSKQLNPKQKAFARRVAQGQTKAEAYRQTYNQNPARSTLVTRPYELASDPRIKREIEAYELALEASKYRTPIALRELVIQTLVQTLVDPDAKHSAKLTAAKILGTVSEVSAFVERKEITHVSSSDDARDQIMAVLSEMVRSQAIDVDPTTLIQELEGTHPSPTPQDAESESRPHVHTIPPKSSDVQPIPPKSSASESDSPHPFQNSDQDSDK
jgi:hypothetical protein